MEAALIALGEQIPTTLDAHVEQFKARMFTRPILDAVTFLPKDELGSMAEALVNLTSVKRKVTLDADTVGGPIDVAIISKGDGLVWMRRKHYFKAELNPQYFATRFGGPRTMNSGENDA